MSISKERREELRDRLASDSLELERSGLDDDELRALLDMADERDRYRALLEEVKTDSGMVGLIEPGTLNRIDAALEGNHD